MYGVSEKDMVLKYVVTKYRTKIYDYCIPC